MRNIIFQSVVIRFILGKDIHVQNVIPDPSIGILTENTLTTEQNSTTSVKSTTLAATEKNSPIYEHPVGLLISIIYRF